MIKKHLITLLLIAVSETLCGQFHGHPWISDSMFYEPTEVQRNLSPKKYEFHGSVGTGVEIGNGHATTYLSASPRVDFHPNDRLTLSMGFSVLGTMDPNRYLLRGNQPRSLIPRRNNNANAAIAAYVAGKYQVNGHLWIAASLIHARGEMIMPTTFTPWGFIPGGWTADVNLTAFSAAMLWKLNDDISIHIQCQIIRDGSGQLWPYYTSPFYNSYMYGFEGNWLPYGGFGGWGGVYGWNGWAAY